MRIMTGERPSLKIRAMADRNGWGEMYIYTPPRKENFHRSGFDNGAWLDAVNERPFDEKRYRDALDRATDMPSLPYLAVVPDLVAGGRESLDFSMGWLDKLPTGWPWYLAVQDGMEIWEVEEVLHLFDGLFLGGTDKFKNETAEDWKNVAFIGGKRFHYARAGTERKVKHAIRIGADSLDSAFPLWTIERMRRMEYLVNDWRTSEPQIEFAGS